MKKLTLFIIPFMVAGLVGCKNEPKKPAGPNTYNITWNNWDGTILGTDTVEEGETPVYNYATPTREQDAQYTYSFTGWSASLTNITDDTSVTAVYSATVNQYTIRFVDEDGETVLDSQTLDYGSEVVYAGEEPTKAADETYAYS